MDSPKKNPHVTDHLANERTFLAWIRTAIAVMTLGVAINRFALFLMEMHQVLPEVRGLANRHVEKLGIEPSRCIHHGPTVSIYYRDPDGNGVELQVDRYATKEATAAYFQTAEFKKNPIGVVFDPEALVQAYETGAPESELLTMPEGPPAAPQSPPKPN